MAKQLLQRSTLGPVLFATAALLITAAALAAPASATPGKELPFSITFTGGSSVEFAPDWTHGGLSTFGGRCSAPSDWLRSWSGSGRASHLGAITASGSDCEHLTNGAAGDVGFDDGEFDLTAANGDTIDGTFPSGDGNFKTGLYPFDWTFDGGTARFASVTGHASAVLQITNGPTPYPVVATGQSVISY